MFSTWPDLLPFLTGARRCRGFGGSLVHRLAYSSDVVAFKMGRRSGLGRTVRAGLAVRGRISKSIRNRSGGRRTAAGPFSTPPSGPRPVGFFSVRRPPDSLDPYQFRDGRFATASPARTALKNSQLTRRLPDDLTIICETVVLQLRSTHFLKLQIRLCTYLVKRGLLNPPATADLNCRNLPALHQIVEARERKAEVIGCLFYRKQIVIWR